MIDTTIIIPSLHSPWIGDVIAALRQQTADLPTVEIIIVGLDQYGLVQETENVRFIATGLPVPPAKARNLGIQAAKGDLLCFLDADCIPMPDWLEQMQRSYRDPTVHVVGGVIRFPHDLWTLADTIAHFANVIEGVPASQQSQLPTLNFSARRAVFAKVGDFDEEFLRPSGEDTELTKRMIAHGYSLWLNPKAVIFHLPKRKSLLEIGRRAYYHGQAATVRSFRQQLLRESVLLRWPLLLLTAAPRAGLVALKLFVKSPHLWRYCYTYPIVFLLKLIWCISAALAMAKTRADKS